MTYKTPSDCLLNIEPNQISRFSYRKPYHTCQYWLIWRNHLFPHGLNYPWALPVFVALIDTKEFVCENHPFRGDNMFLSFLHITYPSFVRFLRMLGRGEALGWLMGVLDSPWEDWCWGVREPGCGAPEVTEYRLVAMDTATLEDAMAMADKAGTGMDAVDTVFDILLFRESFGVDVRTAPVTKESVKYTYQNYQLYKRWKTEKLNFVNSSKWLRYTTKSRWFIFND